MELYLYTVPTDSEVMKIASNMSIFPDIRKNAAVVPIIKAFEEEKNELLKEKNLIEQKNKTIEQKNKTIEYNFVKHVIKNQDLTIEQVAKITNTSIEFVQKVKTEISL